MWQHYRLRAWPPVAAGRCPLQRSAVRAGFRSFTWNPTHGKQPEKQDETTLQEHPEGKGGPLRPKDIAQRLTASRSPAHIRREYRLKKTAKLPYVSVDDFARLTASGQATSDHARSCVYNLKTQVGDQDLPNKRADIAAYHAGGRVLSWLLDQDLAVRSDLSGDQLFVHSVCFFLVAEAREDFVWKWLKLEPSDSRHMWVSGLVIAQHMWHASVVPALSTIRRVLDEFADRKPGFFVGARMAAAQIVENAEIPPYDPVLFDAAYEVVQKCTNEHVINVRCPRLLLFHPTNPSADLLLQLLREQHEGDTRPAGSFSRNALGNHMLRAAYILHLQGRADDASWLRTVVRDEIPAAWCAEHQVRTQLEKDPKLEGLRRSALESAPSNKK